MDPTAFQSPAAGRVVKTPGGVHAFVPAPLPPALRWTPGLVLALSRADAAVGEISGLGSRLPDPRLLLAPFIRREAVLSSRIEGTRAGLADLWLEESEAPGVRESAPDIAEVRGCVRALEHEIRRLATLPLSLRLVREIHGVLMEGASPHLTPGEFRRSQNWIGSSGSTPSTAAYVPPPPEEMQEALGAWERYLHARGGEPDLVQCALLHEHFEAIHPFLDGNGRVGRLLITLFLVERGRLRHPLLYLSDYLESTRARYYEGLRRVRTHGDWEGWLLYFLEGVRVTAEDAVRRADGLLALRDGIAEKVKDAPRALGLVDALFRNPYMTVTRAEEVLRVTNPTARKAVEAMASRGVLVEVTGRSWGRAWLCREILDLAGRRAGEVPA